MKSASGAVEPHTSGIPTVRWGGTAMDAMTLPSTQVFEAPVSTIARPTAGCGNNAGAAATTCSG
jgi:hypothetical protein